MDIEEILYTFEDDYNPSSMVPGPRNMYNQGQLVQPNVDGSRPGYSGERDFGKTVEPNIRLRSGKYDVSYKGESLGSFNKITEARNSIKKAKKDNPPTKTGIVKEGSRGDILRKSLDEFIKDNNTSPSFEEVTEDITFKDNRDKAKYKKVLNSIMQNDEKYSIFKIDTADRLTELEKKIVTDNFELPPGQKEWDFKKQKFGININENPNLAERIKRKIDGPQKYTIAADSAKPSGWMMNAMNRVYKNQTVLKDGKRILKKGVKKLTYQPKFNEDGIIVGFKDTTASGGNKTYYGLKKNTPEDATPWTAHGDHERIKKFLKIAKGAQIDDPSKLLQKILDDKGITKLMGSNVGDSVLTLNDILSHERYYKNISDIAPMKLLERQIVLHHEGGVGAGTNIARAAATKDIQLLSGAVNDNVKKLERIVRGTDKNPARKLNADEIAQLKNYGAKITDFDGKVVGGGFTDPTKQFAGIEKKALEYAKGDQFNVKTVASYLERLGCGKAAGGRILFAEGVPSLTKCAQKGVTKLENGLKSGFKNADEASLARGILKSGKFLKDAVSLRGLFGPAALAFTVAAEAGIVGYDMLSSGKSFREAVGDSVFNYMLGDKTKINPEEEFIKRLKNIPGSPGQGFRGFTDEDINKMLVFKSKLKDMETGFSNYNDLINVNEKIEENTKRQNIGSGFFPDEAFQLEAEKDRIQADIRDYNKVGTPRSVTDYMISDEGIKGGDALARGTLLAKENQLLGVNPTSRRGIESLEKNLTDTRFNLEQMFNPTKYNKNAKYFISRPKSEQSKLMSYENMLNPFREKFMSLPKSEQSNIMSYGYKEGGIASLNVNKK